MKKSCIFAAFALLFLFVSGNAFSGLADWKLKSVADVDDNPLLIYFAWETLRPPHGDLDTVTLHRVVKKNKLLFNDKVIFMLPGTWNAGGWSQITDPEANIMLFLANNGYDVYTLDYRSVNIPDMAFEQFAQYGIDVTPTTDWTYGVFREDIKACVNLIKILSSVDKIFMSGFSRGGAHMFIYASKYQDDLLGLVVLDYYIKDLPPTGIPLDEATYNFMIQLFKAGQLVDPDSGEVIPWLLPPLFFLDDMNYNNLKLAGALPRSKFMVGSQLPTEFDLLADYVADLLHYIWLPIYGEGGFTNYKGGYIDRDILVQAVNQFSRYAPNIQTLEDIQMMAHDDVPYFDYDDNDIFLPAIAFLTEYFGCPQGICLIDVLPNLTKSDDVTINLVSGYGHLDILFGKDSLTDVKQPLLQWLDGHMAAPSVSSRPSIQEIERAFNAIVHHLLSQGK